MNSSPLVSQRLAGKVAIITGGASGIGACTAALFHKNGARVVIADIQDSLGEAVATKLGKGVSYTHCDVSREDDVKNLVDSAVDRYGKLDIMYSNAGIIDRALGGILDSEKSDLDRVISVNVRGAFFAAKHAARVMIPRKQGNILFTSSSVTGIAGISTHAYAATKYGILGMMKNLAAELGEHGIRVNCVSPFAVRTGIASGMSGDDGEAMEALVAKVGNLKGKCLKVDCVAHAALYLASDESYYVSGHNLIIDGGFCVVNPSLVNALNGAV